MYNIFKIVCALDTNKNIIHKLRYSQQHSIFFFLEGGEIICQSL